MSLKFAGFRSQTKIVLNLLALTLLSHCSMENGLNGLGSGSKQGGTRPNDGDAAPEVFDFEKECGLSTEKTDDPNAVLLDASMTSFPIIVEGSTNVLNSTVNFRVITQAKVHITAKGDQSVQDVKVETKDTAATASGIIGMFAPGTTKSKAEAAAKENSGTTTSISVPKKDWLKLTDGSNPEYADLLCATQGTKSLNINKGGKNATVTFTPSLVSSVSPFAPIERMRKEFGPGKSFKVTANVQGSGGGLKPGTAQGTVTVKEVSPTFTFMGKTITADIAWEVVNNFPGGAYTVGLSKRTVMYIDTTNKTIKAIMTEDDKIDETTKKPMPPVYLVKDP